MRPVFINGLGCFESGARGVFRELMRAYPSDGPCAWVVMPSGNRADLPAPPPQVRVLALNHRVFGRWLRPLFEATTAALAKIGFFSRVVNLSHYGWCPGGAYVLYFHNQLLVEAGHDAWSGRGGRPNRFKRWCLRTCLRRAEKIVVQTERVAAAVRGFAERQDLPAPRIEVVVPTAGWDGEAARIAPVEKEFAVQFFYPASAFSHKRAELAVRGVIAANRRDPRLGLVLTLPPPAGAEPPACVRYAGPLTREQVASTYAASDALLFTSAHETLGLPLLEALACGLPAVLPELGYARDVYGDAGFYFAGESAEAVGDALLACVAQRAARKEQLEARRVALRATGKTWAQHWEIFGLVRPAGVSNSGRSR
jgi:glycosyltransferase involved in cell wall biosynthesis